MSENGYQLSFWVMLSVFNFILVFYNNSMSNTKNLHCISQQKKIKLNNGINNALLLSYISSLTEIISSGQPWGIQCWVMFLASSCSRSRCSAIPCFLYPRESGRFFKCIRSFSRQDRLNKVICTRIVLGCLTHKFDWLSWSLSLNDCTLLCFLGLLNLIFSSLCLLLGNLLT